MLKRDKIASAMGTTSPLLLDAFRAARRTAIEAAIFSLFVNLLMLTGPLYMLQIYDRVMSSHSYETLFVITVLVVILFAGMAALDFARGALLARSAAAFEEKLKHLTFDLTLDASRVGLNVADQPLRDLRQIRQFVASPALVAVFDAPWAPIFLGVVFMMHWLLGLVALIGLILLGVLAFINERMSRHANTSAMSLTSEADKHAAASIRNAAAADAMGMRKTLRDRWTKLSDEANNHLLSSTDTIGGLTAASKAFRLFLQSAILGTGAFVAIRGEATPGVMIAASIIAGRALAPIEIVTSQWKNFALSTAAFRRLTKFIEHFPVRSERTALPAPKGVVSVERIFCQPAGAKHPILKNINFSLAAGEALGLIGPSAAGKSTLARAIVGVEPCASGAVRLDGANLSHWDMDALGKYIGYLPQEVELFAGTAAQNIARFRDDAKSEEIIAAAEAAGAHQMILGFPEGYDTDIGERGARLSAGQRQRLGLARALFGDPVLVVLDEPNANLDAEGEAALANAMKGAKARGATVIIVAHRPSAIAFVDKLLFLVGGEVRAFGPRDEVLAQIAPKQAPVLRRVVSDGEAANG
ncbi:MAG: type I secretion system permease/ATPase [Amphiplicatus sp.]|nr:type I secretion system permease/ATPase [Amphiplicatus sp.]